MNIINSGYEILNPFEEYMSTEDYFKHAAKHIEKIARTCYKSENLIKDGSAEKMIARLVDAGHEAMIEHFSITVKFTVDRGVSHEIVRHRLASFAQESTRYVAYCNKPLSIDSDNDIINAYLNGMSMKKISERSCGKYTEWDVYKLLDNNNIEKRGYGSRGIINENYFDTINTPEKAYLLGFIEADGNIRKEKNGFNICQKEDESWWILNMIRRFIQPNAKSLYVYNNHIVETLINYGIIPNKTYDNTEENINILWESIPAEYKYDFIRGLMDGDGSIRWFYQKDTSKTKSCNIAFNGNKFLLKKIADFIYFDIGYSAKVKQDSISKVLYRYVVTDSNAGEKLCNKMYKNFKFPYGHSKTIRYYDAFNIPIPYINEDIEKKAFNVIIPKFLTECDSKMSLWEWGNAMMNAELHYNRMLELGAKPEEARSVLPNSLKTEINVTMNLREWRHYFNLRCEEHAHPQIREVSIPLLHEFQNYLPEVFNDIKY